MMRYYHHLNLSQDFLSCLMQGLLSGTYQELGVLPQPLLRDLENDPSLSKYAQEDRNMIMTYYTVALCDDQTLRNERIRSGTVNEYLKAAVRLSAPQEKLDPTKNDGKKFPTKENLSPLIWCMYLPLLFSQSILI